VNNSLNPAVESGQQNDLDVPLHDSITGGHGLKLVNNRCHYDLRKFSFAPTIVNIWNSLSEIVISVDKNDTFKRRLNK